jgi:hypothetical protein
MMTLCLRFQRRPLTFAALLASAMLAQTAGDCPATQTSPPVASAVVVDMVTLTPVAGAEVIVGGPYGVDAGVSSHDGVATFGALTLPGPPANEEDMTIPAPAEFYVEHPDYLALRRDVVLNTAGSHATLQLVPRRSGVITPLISAATGGRYQLPGVGSLRVPAGTLSHDSYLRVIAIPRVAWSPRASSSTELTYQVWLGAVDAEGNETAALPRGFGGVELTVEVRHLPALANGEERAWRARSIEMAGGTAAVQAATAQSGTSVVTFDLAAGFTQLEYERSGALLGSCNWGPWALGVVPLGSFIAAPTYVSVNCGFYATPVRVTVSAGETITTGHSITRTATARTGWDAGTLFAKASAEFGVSITGSYSSSTATTTMVSSEKKTPETGTINGVPPASLAAPWSCVTGTAKFGLEQTRFRMTASRRCVHPNGTIENETIVLGEMLVPQGVAIEWTASIDASCGEGCEGASLPSLPM